MGGIGVGLLIIAILFGIMAIKGTYKFLPPWSNQGNTNAVSTTIAKTFVLS